MIVASYTVAIYGINTLPSRIAIHFNAAGEANGYGTPTTLLITPVIMTFCLGMISLVAHRCPIKYIQPFVPWYICLNWK